jgi:dTDP-4-dehydrorhamnose 3,5-epimerase
MSAALDVRPVAAIPAVIEITPRRISDERGFFTELFNRRVWRDAGIDLDFVQTNYSFSVKKGTLRGLHFQTPPAAQAKVVTVTRGRIFDVVVDIRRGSPTYGKWVAVEISGERGNQLLVPAGFAHGFLTLEPETHVQYMVTSYYSPANDRGIRFDDPTLAIDWPLDGDPHLSPRDRAFPCFADIDTPFEV